MPGTFTLAGSAPGLPAGEIVFGPNTISGAVNSGAELASVALNSGDNTIAVPAGAVSVWITPPSGNAVALTLRTSANNSDAGLPISPTNPTVLSFPSSTPTSIIIHAASGVTGETIVAFI
jgi:hypothetical protein